MPKYKYEAHDRVARPYTGTVDAATEADAAAMIRDDLKLFALKIEADDGHPIKTVLPGHAQAQQEWMGVAQPAPKASPNVLTKTAPARAETPDDLEIELFGNVPPPQPTLLEQAHQAVEAISQMSQGKAPEPPPVLPQADSKLAAAPSLGAPSWETQLKQDIEQVGGVLRTLRAWRAEYDKAATEKKAPMFGPNVGGQTWGLVDKHFDHLAYEMIKDAMIRASRSH